MPRYHQGKYTPLNPEKYVGDPTNIQYRSSWEKRMFLWLDRTPAVLKWGSEELVIPYISPIDNQKHRYFPDVVMMYKTKGGEVKKAIVEIKPLAQTQQPKRPEKMTKRYITEVSTYAVNQAKWNAAERYCLMNGFEFRLITEKDLNV